MFDVEKARRVLGLGPSISDEEVEAMLSQMCAIAVHAIEEELRRVRNVASPPDEESQL